jgi:hypothetical protein
MSARQETDIEKKREMEVDETDGRLKERERERERERPEEAKAASCDSLKEKIPFPRKPSTLLSRAICLLLPGGETSGWPGAEKHLTFLGCTPHSWKILV